ncbi:MAG: hypothetical protein A3H69_03810 [Candidatus Sungbacteria bacterium RIFCSPLOWO2_02_FULL_47_9]|uniref:Uncharacterized protein n=1 Tax=Candidatus Sungbacteria bacterium RIFCSPHIGHO2_01_FULL_47_32 TaxID=1802264 RepID=A0A1G2K888_9BACT|nr:MAG: hypothetical protein UX72_C0012G0025 [Parcubacteria group bacterium GW2011_GWA2_47_10]OGZ95423.1 MAG: hypothetical protein A2633_05865 [Candidatus Sungbacteria bacterium RIFCSPHIGHO2_01_FULL_47_32]OGZ99582.1 MAG: hypothetical protein A3D57_01330 [Candidatus Sungbacteria bacterium RIFCSPHIGHO2_02_FULL_46_12]OHA06279.1 MAG: hypothetical protein A3A28_02185 [Candidatus Sungbacteria bacterium RIFCSPLOWO2_01_FULL_47_32]OHA11204.1 MAG: hypothetical protein A3H69_03810 [Candidatus Sungbacteria
MEKITASKKENIEKESGVELSILEPDESKGWRVVFKSRTREETAQYNYVMRETLKNENLNPFHQLMADMNNDPDVPGTHWWECLFVKAKRVKKNPVPELGPDDSFDKLYEEIPITKEYMEGLLVKIKEEAEKNLRRK